MQDTQAIAQKALAIPDQARQIKVSDTASYQQGATLLKGIKALRSEIASVFGPIKAKAHAAWKAICDEEKKADAPLTEAEQIIKREMARYDTEQEKIRREEQRRLEEQARKEAEERQKEIIRLEMQGKAEEAKAALQASPPPSPIEIPKSVPKVAGISYREVWKFEITDEASLPREYMIPDLAKIGAAARTLKGSANIPGVRVYSEKVTAVV